MSAAPATATLAQRLARLPGCWRPHMVYDLGDPNGPTFCPTSIEDAGNALQEHGWRPRLSEPATVGCLAAWAQELYADPHLHAVPVMGRVGDGEPAIRWRLARFGGDSLIVDGPSGHRRLEEPTRVDAWASAILAKLEPK